MDRTKIAPKQYPFAHLFFSALLVVLFSLSVYQTMQAMGMIDAPVDNGYMPPAPGYAIDFATACAGSPTTQPTTATADVEVEP